MSNTLYKGYEPVIGAEVHVELKTAEKAFCSCSAAYGDVPNRNCCPICLGMPGAIPCLNGEAVRLAVRAGLALNCRISEISYFDRKHYFYPDLPKGYQITQFYSPLCLDGYVTLSDGEKDKKIRIREIHMEEDAGKLSYSENGVNIDNNRCGVPLIEIVTEPDMRSSAEAMSFVNELRRRLLFAGVSDCKMNEGSLRCDINISVRKEGENTLGERCEIKNINSVNFIGRAIECEIKRQVDILEGGGKIECETRRFSESFGRTERMRSKETCSDYRYIREPDIPPIRTDNKYVEHIRAEMPRMPKEIKKSLKKLGISDGNAEIICTSPETAAYFESAISDKSDALTLSNLFVSEVFPKMKDSKSILSPEKLSEIAAMYSTGEINIVSAKKLIAFISENGNSPREIAGKMNLFMIRDAETIKTLVLKAAELLPEAVSEVKKGKLGAKKVIVGYVMRETGGKADPVLANREVDRFFNSKE